MTSPLLLPPLLGAILGGAAYVVWARRDHHAAALAGLLVMLVFSLFDSLIMARIGRAGGLEGGLVAGLAHAAGAALGWFTMRWRYRAPR
jgi:amino acid transporter